MQTARVGDRARRVALFLATLLVLALPLASRADAYVYWANTGDDFRGVTIGRANLDGTGANQSFITAADGPYGVAVDAAHIYWVNAVTNTIGRANLDGTGANPSFIPTADAPRGVAVDGAHVYWTLPFSHTIGRANLDGTGANQSFITVPNNGSPFGLAVEATHIYWGNSEGTIGRARLDGTGIFGALIQGANFPEFIAVDATHVYWTNGGVGGTTIGRANLDGTSANQSFITGASFPSGVAVDGASVYWTNVYPTPGGGAPPQPVDKIGRANLNGTAANQSFISGANIPNGVAVDSGPLPPSNAFTLGKVKRNKRKGTAELPVSVPDGGTVLLGGRKLKHDTEEAQGPGEVELLIKAKGKAKKELRKTGKAKVKAKVTFTPTGGTPNTESRKIKLIKK